MAQNQTITQVLTKDPLRTITVGITVVGLIVSVANFYILSRLEPLASRVDAIERRNITVEPLITRFIQLEERDTNLREEIGEIKQDLRDIKQFLNIR